MNDLIHHILLAVNASFDNFIFFGMTVPDKNGDSEIVFESNGDPVVIKGLLEAALHSVNKDIDDKTDTE
jgi:hypothetical protein